MNATPLRKFFSLILFSAMRLIAVRSCSDDRCPAIGKQDTNSPVVDLMIVKCYRPLISRELFWLILQINDSFNVASDPNLDRNLVIYQNSHRSKFRHFAWDDTSRLINSYPTFHQSDLRSGFLIVSSFLPPSHCSDIASLPALRRNTASIGGNEPGCNCSRFFRWTGSSWRHVRQ